MPDLYEKNGVLLLDDDGVSLRGCCCGPACSMIRVYVSLSATASGSTEGDAGQHSGYATLYAGLCQRDLEKNVDAPTWSRFENYGGGAAHGSPCLPVGDCEEGEVKLNKTGLTYNFYTPWRKGTTRTKIGQFTFSSTKRALVAGNITATYAVEYLSELALGVPAETATSKRPKVELVVDSSGVSGDAKYGFGNVTANGTNASGQGSASPTSSTYFGNFTIGIFVT